jgi:polysaccharide biosynthesis protein PslA
MTIEADIRQALTTDTQSDVYTLPYNIKLSPLTTGQQWTKTVTDCILTLCILGATAPLLILISVLIRFDSPGPSLFRQPRIGLDGKLFTMFKFRTMYTHLSDIHASQQTVRNDQRVTRVGRWLRRTSLDELPQLFNILRGEMSLVGPRPHALNTKAGGRLFQVAVPNYEARHCVKPGITGWAQINGCRGETTTIRHLERRVAHDLFYIKNWSLRLDLQIMILTLWRELNNKDVF